MTTRNERKEIAALHRASNGQGDSPHDNSRKRPRDVDASSGAPRRRTGVLTGPYLGIGQSNLQDHRSHGRRTLKRDSSPSIAPTDSRLNTSKTSLGYAVFKPRSGVLDDSEPSARATYGTEPSPRFPPSIQQPSPMPSKEINEKMDGASGGEGTLSLAAVLGEATIPQTPERADYGSIEPSSHDRSRSRSSSDPINIIELVDGDSQPFNSASHPINVDDDEIVDNNPPSTRRRPSTPKGTSIIQKGKVKQTTLIFERNPPRSTTASTSTSTPARTEPNLEKFLVPKPTQASGTFTFTASRGATSKNSPNAPILSTGSTSKGLPITIGATRHKIAEGKISTRMQGKSQTSGLKILNQPLPPPPSQKPPPRAKVRDPKSRDLTFHIQEWYCDPRHYESNASQGTYSFNFNGNMIKIIFSERPGIETSNLCLMKGDVDWFEVVDTAEDESYLWMLILLEKRTLSGTHWKRDGLGESDQVLLHFLGSDGPSIHDRWKALIQELAKWTQKRTMKKSAMNSLIKRATDGNSFHVPIVQDISVPTLQRELKSEAKARTPPSKPRTRSAVSNSNQGEPEKDSEPIVIQDPDEIVLVHPTGTGSVTINRGELARLEPGEFLNDTLIELGLKMWLNDLRAQDPALADQVHIFSSFFFKKLDAGRGKGCDYSSVKKWTAKFDLFSKKFIIVPINEHLHWYLAIICFPEHVLEAPLPQPPAQSTRVTRSSDAAAKAGQRMSSESDMHVDPTPPIDADAGSPTVLGGMEVDTELADRSEKMVIDYTTPPESQSDVVDVDPKPNDSPMVDATNDDSGGKNPSRGTSATGSEKTWILILDSLGGKHPRTARILREYLQAEAQERRGKVVDIKDTRSSGGLVEDKHLLVPVQPNWCDCGVYLLHYVEVFYANPLEIIALPPGAKRKSKEAGNRYDELWRTDQVKDKRTAFREKLHKLSTKWLESKSSSSKSAPPLPGTLPPSRITAPIPLSHPQNDPSILEIHPLEIRDASTAITTEPPSSSSGLPPGLLGYPALSSPSTTIKDTEEVEGIIHPTSPAGNSTINLSSGSDQSSSTSKPTRRGVKGGSRHGSKHSSDHEVEDVSEIMEDPVKKTVDREVSVDL
ncbi:unnamed protein product [Rhizoctonia solani]|uniref:Ubiquitin-like protease family profile domain-containing protein n=1 Tax=Rhizoctonia solani TaxID=456999 RepID=A0A8H3HBW1_9AGAM|nr:unnamed protein product [Rhizoctonia solani]